MERNNNKEIIKSNEIKTRKLYKESLEQKVGSLKRITSSTNL
jgi:hypothetical protein